MPRSNVVITGLGVVSSIGIGRDPFFQALLEKRSGITSLADRSDEGAKPNPDSEPAGLWIGGPVIDFDAKQYVRPRKALKVMCREIQTAYAASQLAIEDAGLMASFPIADGGPFQPADVGTVFGSEMFYGPPSEMLDAIRASMDDQGQFDATRFGSAAMKNVTPLWMLKYLPNMPACHVGIALGAHGPNNTLVLGDVSGPAALVEAHSCLQRQIAKVMIACGTGTRINTTRLNYRGDLPIAEVYQPVSHSSRPHDPQSRGVVGGEGAAAVVLEDADAAAARGVSGCARIVSYASRFVPARGMFKSLRSPQLEPRSRGSASAIHSAIAAALQSASLTAADVAMVVSHASGDPVIDAAEREALQATLPKVPMTAPMAAVGHTGAASGSMGLVTGALALVHQTIPPTLQTPTTDAGVGLSSDPRPLQGDHVLCLAHTPEGGAMAVVLGHVNRT